MNSVYNLRLWEQKMDAVHDMWFWSEEHQAAECEAEADLAAGRYRTFDDAESFLADLAELVAETPDEECDL
jgi:hypothetical protein